MEKYDIRLIALDLDRTTLDSTSRLSARTKAAIEAAIEKGIHVIVATGRAFSALPEDVYKISGLKYIITSNGATVRELATGEVIYRNCIEGPALERVVELLKQYGFMYEFFVDGRAYVEKAVYDHIDETTFLEKHRKYIKATRQPVVGLLDFALQHKDAIENINVNFEDQGDKAAMKPILAGLAGVTLTSSFDHNLELGGETTSKADAVNMLCNMYGIKPEHVMACGDSPNDLAMLEFSGLPIAIGNAKDELKAAAKYVTSTNDEEGVAEVIEKFVLS